VIDRVIYTGPPFAITKNLKVIGHFGCEDGLLLYTSFLLNFGSWCERERE